jgi:hypothetical protein
MNTMALTVTTTQLDLSPDELDLVRSALALLLATLGREEADEIREIEALLLKLDAR